MQSELDCQGSALIIWGPKPVYAIISALTWLGERARWVLAAGIVLGLAVPPLAELFRPLLAPAVFLTLTLAMLRVDLTEVVAQLRQTRQVAFLLVLMMVATPAVLSFGLPLLGLPFATVAAVALMACAPPIGGSANMAYLLGLPAVVALVCSIAGTLLTPLVAPPLALALLGLDLKIALIDFMARLGLLVGACLLSAAIIRHRIGHARLVRHSRAVDGLAAIVMNIFALAIMAGVTERAFSEPDFVLTLTGIAFLANFALQAGTACVAWITPIALGGVPKREALSVGLMAGNRNMGLILAALPPGADSTVALYFALAQLPMFMTPLLCGPVYRLALGRLTLR